MIILKCYPALLSWFSYYIQNHSYKNNALVILLSDLEHIGFGMDNLVYLSIRLIQCQILIYHEGEAEQKY